MIGFFYIIDFGLTQEQVDRHSATGKPVFELPLEEKLKFRVGGDGIWHTCRRHSMPGDPTSYFKRHTVQGLQPQVLIYHPAAESTSGVSRIGKTV
jgi:isopenicillin N synthase-like dioxygenase